MPFIVAQGADWYRQWGTERSPGLKLFSVSGHVQRPGVYELPLATPMSCLLYTSDAADDLPCVDLGGRRLI